MIKRTLRKITAITLLSIVIVTVVGCGNTNDEDVTLSSDRLEQIKEEASKAVSNETKPIVVEDKTTGETKEVIAEVIEIDGESYVKIQDDNGKDILVNEKNIDNGVVDTSKKEDETTTQKSTEAPTVKPTQPVTQPTTSDPTKPVETQSPTQTQTSKPTLKEGQMYDKYDGVTVIWDIHSDYFREHFAQGVLEVINKHRVEEGYNTLVLGHKLDALVQLRVTQSTHLNPHDVDQIHEAMQTTRSGFYVNGAKVGLFTSKDNRPAYYCTYMEAWGFGIPSVSADETPEYYGRKWGETAYNSKEHWKYLGQSAAEELYVAYDCIDYGTYQLADYASRCTIAIGLKEETEYERYKYYLWDGGIPKEYIRHSLTYGDLQIIEYPRGDIQQTYPDGKVRYIYTDGRIKTTYPNGTVEMKYPDGRTETIN